MRRHCLSQCAALLAGPLLLASHPATAAPPVIPPPAPPAPKVLAQWTSIDQGLFITFLDAADGSLSLDKTTASQKQVQFKGVSVFLLDNGVLVLGTLQNSKLTVIAQFAEVNTSDLTLTIGHFKSADGKTFFDGAVYAATDLKTGAFVGTLTEISQDGKSSETTHIDLNLSAPG